MIYLYILTMAVTTYLIRALPLTLWKKPITSPFLRAFLRYIPSACLAAMTFPAILSATSHPLGGAAGLAAALIQALRGKGLLPVALTACAAVLAVELFLPLPG